MENTRCLNKYSVWVCLLLSMPMLYTVVRDYIPLQMDALRNSLVRTATTTVRTATMARTATLFSVECAARLHQAGLWNKSQWKFVESSPQKKAVIWLARDPLCYTKVSGQCLPYFEVNWTFSVTLRFVKNAIGKVIADGSHRTLAQGGIYISHGTSAPVQLLAKVLRICDAGASLIHLSDESGKQTDSYSDWSVIVRQYWDKDVANNKAWRDKLVVIPLGPASDFWLHDANDLRRHPERLPNVTARRYTWTFMGDTGKSTRASMISAMNKVPGGKSNISHGFGRFVQPPFMVRNIMMQSLFCPAPFGTYSPDTFRFSEALEAGCFPIVDAGSAQRTYFGEFFEHWGEGRAANKFITHVSMEMEWSRIPSRIAEALNNMSALQIRQAAMVSWWAQFKDKFARKVAALILATDQTSTGSGQV